MKFPKQFLPQRFDFTNVDSGLGSLRPALPVASQGSARSTLRIGETGWTFFLVVFQEWWLWLCVVMVFNGFISNNSNIFWDRYCQHHHKGWILRHVFETIIRLLWRDYSYDSDDVDIIYIWNWLKLYNDILQYYVLVAKYHTMPVHASPIILHYQRCRSLQMTYPTTRSQPLTDRHAADARALCLVKWSLTFSHISHSQEKLFGLCGLH